MAREISTKIFHWQKEGRKKEELWIWETEHLHELQFFRVFQTGNSCDSRSFVPIWIRQKIHKKLYENSQIVFRIYGLPMVTSIPITIQENLEFQLWNWKIIAVIRTKHRELVFTTGLIHGLIAFGNFIHSLIVWSVQVHGLAVAISQLNAMKRTLWMTMESVQSVHRKSDKFFRRDTCERVN